MKRQLQTITTAAAASALAFAAWADDRPEHKTTDRPDRTHDGMPHARRADRLNGAEKASELIGLGIPEIEAKRYEGKIKEGNILISVHTENSEEITKAKDIFTHAGAHDICVTGEATAPTPKDSKDTAPMPPPGMTASYAGSR